MRKVTIVLALLCCVAAQECNPRQFTYDSVVCVCDATYCDQPGVIEFPEEGSFTVITSSREGLRFNVETLPVSSEETPDAEVVTLNKEDVYQTILGFGGGFSDSTGYNVVSLSSELQDQFFISYFAPEGIGYTFGRIPIAGTDCSTRIYSYDDVEGDVDLEYWSLTEEDHEYKIPLILRAHDLTTYPLKLIATPWAPPAWMKSNGAVNGSGVLIREFFQPYANYIVKFVEAYEAEGVELWGLTPANEPLGGLIDWDINTCGWSSESIRDWLKDNLGPALDTAGYSGLKIMIHDFNRNTLPWNIDPILEDPDSAQYVYGIALHWYEDTRTNPEVLDEVHELYPDRFILYTEAAHEHGIQLGSWERAEEYVNYMLDDLNHYSTGWLDWNMALDTVGGPNWIHKYRDSPIIVDAEADEFYKQPVFYTIGHVSKFVVPGAERISWSTTATTLQVAAFNDPSGRTVVVILNLAEVEEDVTVTDGSETYLNFRIPAKAIQTILY
ncbi:lysosomal acid glucosylceramidase [Cherax quadricarinatus]|nr:lysosomal acid glucosylceramidase-like [Cherax quadricarinatus]